MLHEAAGVDTIWFISLFGFQLQNAWSMLHISNSLGLSYRARDRSIVMRAASLDDECNAGIDLALDLYGTCMEVSVPDSNP